MILFKKLNRLLSIPFLLLIRIYQKMLSPLLPSVCRFYPSCSEYGLQAFRRHGVLGGAFLTLKRVLRCNPLFPGGIDEVPDQLILFQSRRHG